jgi:hypothetical protein
MKVQRSKSIQVRLRRAQCLDRNVLWLMVMQPAWALEHGGHESGALISDTTANVPGKHAAELSGVFPLKAIVSIQKPAFYMLLQHILITG